MQTRELSKLQIRAEVLSIIQQYNTESDLRTSQQNQDIDALMTIKDRIFVIEILLKELITLNNIKRTIIAHFISNLAKLEEIEEILWDFLKNPKIADEIKETLLNILRNLGGKISTDELLNYLENPDALIDKETKNLLEIAQINPEAQIDFLDFLFALKKEEQIQLIHSLKDDYLGDDLANILVPTLESNPEPELLEIIIESLGLTKSYIAIEPLLELEKNSKDENITRLVRKNLNQLKIGGINFNDTSKLHTREMNLCSLSQVFEAYASQIDGLGNQGIIFSRIQDYKIYMFSVVINDKEGLIDCFGFSGISKDEFEKIIERFTQSSTVITVPPEYCKTKFLNAEKTSKKLNKKIPYEYSCWKAYIYDVKPLEKELKDLIKYDKMQVTAEDYNTLYGTGDFDTWFFEYGDKEKVNELLEYTCKNFNNESPCNIEIINQKIDETIKIVADEEIQQILASRLIDSAYLYNIANQETCKNICLNLSGTIEKTSLEDFKNITFVTDLFRRSIIQYAAYCIEESTATAGVQSSVFGTKTAKEKTLLSPTKAMMLIDYLEEFWT